LDPLKLEPIFERLFGFPMPGVILTAVLAFVALATVIWAIRTIVEWVVWVRARNLADLVITASQSRFLQRITNLKFIARLVVVIWAVLTSATVWRLNDDMVRYVLPRQMTDAQKGSLASALSKANKPHDVHLVIADGDEEASSYAGEIWQAIEKGGWPVVNIARERNLRAGVTVDFKVPMERGKTSEDLARERVRPPDPRPDETLLRAFREAGLHIDGSSGGSHRDRTTTTLTVTVGPRRRDYNATPRPSDADR
jgi:hypothetical protein